MKKRLFSHTNFPSSEKLYKCRLNYIQRITEVDQKIVMDLFPGELEPIRLPIIKRASFKNIPQLKIENQQLEILSRVFEDQYQHFEINHTFWNLNENRSILDQAVLSHKDSEKQVKMEELLKNCQDNNYLAKNVQVTQTVHKLNYSIQTPIKNTVKVQYPNEIGKHDSLVKIEQNLEENQVQNTFTKLEHINLDRGYIFNLESDDQDQFQKNDNYNHFESNSFQNCNGNSQKEKILSNCNYIQMKIMSETQSSGIDDGQINQEEIFENKFSSNHQKEALNNSKKKGYKNQSVQKERQKRSKYYERMAVKEAIQNDAEEVSEDYIQSRDISIHGLQIEVYGIQSYHTNKQHWLFGENTQNTIQERQEEAYKFLERIQKNKENNCLKNDLRTVEILNACSFILQTSKIHQEFEEFFSTLSNNVESNILDEQDTTSRGDSFCQTKSNLKQINTNTSLDISSSLLIKSTNKNNKFLISYNQQSIPSPQIFKQPTISQNQIQSDSLPQIEETQDENVIKKINLENQKQKIQIENKNMQQTFPADTTAGYYQQVIHQFFKINVRNKVSDDEFDFNNIKTSKSIYSNTDPSKKKFGIEVMVVNSEDDEIQIERVKKNYGKFHNFNKLFMYNIVKMFSEYNLENLSVPMVIIQEIQSIINKIKVSARRRNNSNKDVQYDYFSIAHYNILFYQIKQFNTDVIRDYQEYIHFYKKCFQIDIKSDSRQVLSTMYANIIKKFCFMVYLYSINKSLALAKQVTEKTPRQEYILKATEGIQNLQKGMLVRRF